LLGDAAGSGGGTGISGDPGVSISPPNAAVDNRSERQKAVMRGAIFLIFFFLGEMQISVLIHVDVLNLDIIT
jgi:hypothetical protein